MASGLAISQIVVQCIRHQEHIVVFAAPIWWRGVIEGVSLYEENVLDCHEFQVVSHTASLTFLLNEWDVDWHKRPACGATSVEDVSTDASRDTRQRRRYQTECSTRLHHRTWTPWTQRQTVTGRQVPRKQRLTSHFLYVHTYTRVYVFFTK